MSAFRALLALVERRVAPQYLAAYVAGEVDPEVDEPALLAYVREKKGAVTTAEVASRTGWPLERAERELTKMVAQYDGNIAVTDQHDAAADAAQLGDDRGAQRPARPVLSPSFWFG